MNLYDRAVDLATRLSAARDNDAGEQLVVRGTVLADALDEVSAYLEEAQRVALALLPQGRLPIDSKAMSQAVNAFRGGLATHQAAAFQHQPATKLQDFAKSQRQKCERSIREAWVALFSPADPLLQRVQDGLLVGGVAQRASIQTKAQKLSTAQALNPVTDQEAIRKHLGGDGVEEWKGSISQLVDDLALALREMEDEQDALSPAVLEALRKAKDDGLPLSELTDDLLGELRKGGFDKKLMVRDR
jgi:hypothetical protein